MYLNFLLVSFFLILKARNSFNISYNTGLLMVSLLTFHKYEIESHLFLTDVFIGYRNLGLQMSFHYVKYAIPLCFYLNGSWWQVCYYSYIFFYMYFFLLSAFKTIIYKCFVIVVLCLFKLTMVYFAVVFFLFLLEVYWASLAWGLIVY